MKNSDLNAYKERLLERRLELNESIRRVDEQVREGRPVEVEDYGDRAAQTYTKESLFQQMDLDRTLLGQVEDALRRLEEGHFGECVECGRPIESRRLQAVPWASHCIVCEQRAQRSFGVE